MLLFPDWTPESVPDPRAANYSYVSDPHRYLSEPEIGELNGILGKMEKERGTQFAVVILDRISESWDIHSFGVTLFEQWGLGQEGLDNGLLLLIVMETRDWRFITGYGLESILTDALLKHLGDNYLVPKFRDQKYGKGLIDICLKISRIALSQDPQKTADRLSAEKPWWKFWIAAMWILWGAVFIPGFRSLFKNGRNNKVSSLKTYSVKIIENRHSRFTLHGVRNTELLKNGKIIRFFSVQVLFLIIPVSAMTFSARLPNPLFNSLIASYIWLVLMNFIGYIGKNKIIAKRSDNKIDEVLHLQLAGKGMGFKAFLFPLPFLFLYILFRKKMNRMKNGPFPCPICGADSIYLSDAELEAVLSPQKMCEKRIGSIDHRGFRCPDQHTMEIPFDGNDADLFSICSDCGTRAMKRELDRIIQEATTTSTGLGEKVYRCAFCHKETN